MGWQEQVCRRHGKRPFSYERWLKKARARAERRKARQDPEKAETLRRFRGYSD